MGRTPKRSLYRRVAWHPVVSGLMLGWFVYRIAFGGFTIARTCGLAVAILWFVLSAVDLAAAHRFLDWLYDDDPM